MLSDTNQLTEKNESTYIASMKNARIKNRMTRLHHLHYLTGLEITLDKEGEL